MSLRHGDALDGAAHRISVNRINLSAVEDSFWLGTAMFIMLASPVGGCDQLEVATSV